MSGAASKAGRPGAPARVGVVVAALLAASLPTAAHAERAVVTGVGADDMLKLRAGPGTGYRVRVGLPDGTVVITGPCQRIGGTPWCRVRLAGVRGLSGYVSGHYLRRDPP